MGVVSREGFEKVQTCTTKRKTKNRKKSQTKNQIQNQNPNENPKVKTKEIKIILLNGLKYLERNNH